MTTKGTARSKTETSTGKIEEYTWDHRNRLTKVVFRNTSGGAIVKQVDYEYDAYNRLVRRTFDADGAGAGAATNQYWVYDEGINAVLQFDGSSASNLSHRYLWSDNVDELLADEQIAGNNTLWGLADHLGSLRDIADYSESTGVTTITNHRTHQQFRQVGIGNQRRCGHADLRSPASSSMKRLSCSITSSVGWIHRLGSG
jgi:hypothetical protein